MSASPAGAGLVLTTRDSHEDLCLHTAFPLTTTTWVVMPAFAALPFALSELNLTYADAFFAAMSGLTTTGSTVIGFDLLTATSGAAAALVLFTRGFWRA